MQRRIFLRNTACIGGALLLQQQLMAMLLQQPGQYIKMLTKHTGIYTEKGGTILFVLGKEGIVVVDSEFAEQSQHLIDELKKKSAQPFSLLINTHHHADHTAGNISFKGLVSHVVAHHNSLTNQKNVAVTQKNEDKQLYPDKIYEDVWQESSGNIKYGLYYYGPGHTNGDSVVHIENDNIVHMGDLVFNRRHPFIDRTAGASITNWIKVLDKTMDKFDRKTTFVFGHAADNYPVTGTKEDIKAFQDYLANLLKYTSTQIKAGKSKEDILSATEIPGSPEWKGDGIQRPLTAAYEELTTTT